MNTRKPTSKTQQSLKALERIIGKKPTLGDYLLAVRQCQDKTQGGFADLLEISRQYLCDIEKNRRVIMERPSMLRLLGKNTAGNLMCGLIVVFIVLSSL